MCHVCRDAAKIVDGASGGGTFASRRETSLMVIRFGPGAERFGGRGAVIAYREDSKGNTLYI